MKILVVEDEKKIAQFVKKGLEEAEGIDVTLSYDGADATKKLAATKYDLLITDIMLPKKDGIQLVKELREAENHIPVLFLTAKNTIDDIVAGLNAGSDDYLTKPFDFQELNARVNALLRRSSYDRGAEIVFADLVLDPVTHQVWRSGKLIDLTTKEYGLLSYLVKNAGTVLTRKNIADHVWDYEFDSFTNIIDVYVNYIRKKIDKGFEKRLIHTIRGKGYIIKEG